MKCYVCYYCSDGDYSEPKKVFWYRKDAVAWVAEDKTKRAYEEIKIE